MALIKGILKNASGVRPNTKIILEAAKTTNSVIVFASDQTIITDANGNYSFECNPSTYKVTIMQQGMQRENVGVIQVYSDSLDGSLNDFLTMLNPDDVTPEIIKELELLRNHARESADRAEAAADNAANDAADEFSQQFQDRFNTLAPIPWTPNTLIEANQSLQVFEHDGLFYLPNVKKLPFTTGAVFNVDNWILSELMVKSSGVLSLNPTADLSLNSFSIGQKIKTSYFSEVGDGGGCDYIVKDTQSPDGFDIDLKNGLFANPQNPTSPRQVGWTEAGGDHNHYLLFLWVYKGYASNVYKTHSTLNTFTTEWLAGNKYPLAFYGDSTTDGATTTGHVASFVDGAATDFNSKITINKSPSSYSSILEQNMKGLIGSKSPLRIYNAGFDSMSAEFGTYCFDRVFFGYADGLNNVDYSDVKGIAICWGTSDSINTDNVQQVVWDYTQRLEEMVINCLERGIQPFICDPVLNFQRVGMTQKGRDNDESISVIEAINQKMRTKYNLEQLSLRVPLEMYVEHANGNGDFLEVLSPDGVHPNDQGHRQIASYFTARLNPLVKYFKADDEYKFTAGNPYSITSQVAKGVDMWKAVDQASLITKTSFFWQFLNQESNQFMYRLAVFCESEMDLTYDCLCLQNGQKSVNDTSEVVVTNYTYNTINKGYTFSDNQTPQALVSGGHQLIARLGVGFNVIDFNAPVNGGDVNSGFFRIEPRYTANRVSETVTDGYLQTLCINDYDDIKYLKSTTNDISWCCGDPSRSVYQSSVDGTEMRITFTANTIQNRAFAWCGNRKFKEFDTYNLAEFSGKQLDLHVVSAGVKTLIKSFALSVDVSTLINTTFIIYVNVDATSKAASFIVQYVTGLNSVDNLLVGELSSDEQILTSGYGFGACKIANDPVALVVSGAQAEFTM